MGQEDNTLRAFLSLLALSTDFLHTPHAKITSLFFDEIICQVPTNNNPSVEADYICQLDPTITDSTYASLRRQFRNISDILPSYTYNPYEFLEARHQGSPSSQELVRLAQIGVEKVYREIDPPPDSENLRYWQYEVLKVGLFSAHTLATWFQLRDTNCSFLGEATENGALQEWFRSFLGQSSGELLTSMVFHGVPDFGELSWNEIYELKQHKNYHDFRIKCLEVVALSNAGTGEQARRCLKSAIDTSLRELALKVRPKIGFTVVKGVLSNLPLPIPINPLSLGDMVSSSLKEIDISKKYGWLYFVLDGEARRYKL